MTIAHACIRARGAELARGFVAPSRVLEQQVRDRRVELDLARGGNAGAELEEAVLPIEDVEHDGARVTIDVGRARSHDLAFDEVDPRDELVARDRELAGLLLLFEQLEQ